MGETLGDGYAQQVDTGLDMVSPDNVIDASVCQAPMNTWFIKNLGHIAYDMNDGTGDFYVWLLTQTEKYDIQTNEEYPQFMFYNTIGMPMLLTWEEKAEIEEQIGETIDKTVEDIKDHIMGELEGVLPDVEIPDIQIPELPSFDIDGVVGAVTGGIESLLGGLGGTGGGGMDLGGIVDTITGLGGMLGGLVGGLDIGGLLGGLLGGGGEETPEEPEEETEEPTIDAAPAPQEPTVQAPTQNAPSHNNSNNQSTGSAPIQVEGGNYNLWLAVVIATLAILGILVVVL